MELEQSTKDECVKMIPEIMQKSATKHKEDGWMKLYRWIRVQNIVVLKGVGIT